MLVHCGRPRFGGSRVSALLCGIVCVGAQVLNTVLCVDYGVPMWSCMGGPFGRLCAAGGLGSAGRRVSAPLLDKVWLR